MKLIVFIIILCSILGTRQLKGDSSQSSNIEALKAEGVVIDNLVDEKYSKIRVITINISSKDAEELQHLTPGLLSKGIRLISELDFQNTFPGKTFDDVSAASLELKIIRIEQNEAEVVGGTPMRGLGGYRFKYVLKRVGDKWIIATKSAAEVATNLAVKKSRRV